MLAVGRWLKTNGEAIFATRPWKIVGEGDETKLHARQWKFSACDASDIRFTRSKDGRYLYAIILGYPKSGRVRIRTLSDQTVITDGGIRRISLLGHGAPLKWKRDAVSLDVELPPSTDHEQPAYALKIEPVGALHLE
ncbi:MAG: alpha-L-fucosidase C-terminal domain-containing protein [Sedimentisphaerales bacterium]